MSRPSSARGIYSASSPIHEKRFISSFLSDDRNNEVSHNDALQAAQAEHDRVRQAAIRVFELHEMREEHKRIMEEEKKEEERLRAEAAIAAEAKRLQELKAKSIPKPPPVPDPPQPAAQARLQDTTQPASASKIAASAPNLTKQAAESKPSIANPFASTSQGPLPSLNQTAAKPNGFQTPQTLPQKSLFPPSSQQSAPTAPPAALPKVVAPPQPPPQSQSQAQLASQPQRQQSVAPKSDRYAEIHQELKKLRTRMQSEAKAAGPPLKGQMGDFRRVIRVSVGQLTGGKGANIQPIQKITGVLREALEGRVPSSPVDVKLFVVKDRQPSATDVPNNGPQLPSLFIYLLNVCAKAIINQFINEGGANPKAADPVGVFAAHIFSNKDFQWRGESLIDIMMAKFRIVCPVLFGFRGNDKTERGRVLLGWKRDEGAWLSEQAHNNRMTGLGAGFASVSLRDFSKASKANPYPPSHYWKAFAFIVNTPMNETSNTQYVVLRAMIEGHELRFLNFYGNAALAALKMALVEFPKKAPAGAPAVGSLQALAEVLRNEGLAL